MIVDIDGKITYEDYTAEEILEKEREFLAAKAAEAEARAEAKAAAQSKLEALGLTVEDLQALGL